SEEHTSELQSQSNLVCRLLLEKKKAQRRADVSVQRAQAVVSRIAAAHEAEYPDANTNRGAILSSGSASVRPSDRLELVPMAALEAEAPDADAHRRAML